jgi:hypothetical protein
MRPSTLDLTRKNTVYVTTIAVYYIVMVFEYWRLGLRSRYKAEVPGIEPGRAHPPSCTMGTTSLSGIMRPERDVNHQPSSSPEV